MIQWDNGFHYGILINNASNISIIDCDFKTSSVYNQRVLSITCRPSGDVVGILIEGVKVSGFTMQDTESLADSSIFRVNCSNAHFIFSDSIFQSNTGQISITADHELQLENITVDSSGNNQAELVYISTPSVSIEQSKITKSWANRVLNCFYDIVKLELTSDQVTKISNSIMSNYRDSTAD